MADEGVGRRTILRALGTGLGLGAAGCSARPPGTRSGDAAATGEAATATAESTGQGTAGTRRTGDAAADDRGSVYTRAYRAVIDSVTLVRTDDGQGSGFVYDPAHVVTNAHVVGEADAVDLRFRGGAWRRGRVRGVDVYSDLAVVAVEDVPAAATPLALQTGAPVVGQEVVVVGNPFGLDGTVTTGIVSGTNRSIPSPTGFSIPDAVQTDAAVNPGNSGGPIVSLDGEVVAVINSGGGENVAFGISAALTRRVVASLIDRGEFDHSFVGVTLEPVTPAVAAANGIDPPRGILVVEVLDGGPAEGVLRPSDETATVDGERVPVGGDVLLGIEFADIDTVEDLGSYLALHAQPGDVVDLGILRDGRERTVTMQLGERPEV